jgi:diguanylate cyclase (GGDEF)-like protein
MTRRPSESAGKLALLRRAALFAPLTQAELRLLAANSAYRSCAAGERIFGEGPHDQELHLVKSGAVVIRKRAPDGNERDIARFIEGEVFAEMDLLDASPRTASAFADGEVTLLRFPAPGLAFRDLLERRPEAFARILEKLLGVMAGRIRAVNRLVSEKTPWVEELKRQLHRDKLTGLFNRTYLDEELPGILGRSVGTALLVLKPDNFKAINDTCGHDAGDRTLVMLGELVRSRLAEGDAGVRYRGDEFCLVLPGREPSRALEAADGLRDAVRGVDMRKAAGRDFPPLTASVGVAVSPDDGADAKTLVARAFERMWGARNAGGDRVLSLGQSEARR